MKNGILKRSRHVVVAAIVGMTFEAILAVVAPDWTNDAAAQSRTDAFVGIGGDADKGALAQPARSEVACVAYEHAGFRGSMLRMTEGQRFDRLSSWNDRISSISLAQGCALRVGEREGFRGRSDVFDQDAAYIGGRWNDEISSVSCECETASWRRDDQRSAPPERARRAACVVYDRRDFGGDRLEMTPDQSYARLRNWNDRVSSVRIAPGCELRVGEHWNFGGAREAVGGDVRYLGSRWSNRISSMACDCDDGWDRPDGGAAGGAPEPSRYGAACIAFSGRDFSGAWQAFEAGDPRETLGRRLEREVSSVAVAPGCVALLDVNRPYKLWIEQNVRSLDREQRDRADAVSCFCPRRLP